MKIRALISLVLGGVLAVSLFATATASAPANSARPHILDLQYYEDLEDGPRYNLTATIKGDPADVRIRMGGRTAVGRLSHQISPSGQGKSWFFRHRVFVRAVRDKLERDGSATLDVGAFSQSASTIKRCTLVLQPDPVYGDFAGGDCQRVVNGAGTP
jgi:hypothetical protein